LASRGKDSQTDDDKKYSLKKRKEEAENAKPDENPADGPDYNMLYSVHSVDLVVIGEY
jgi:hypothetical protein